MHAFWAVFWPGGAQVGVLGSRGLPKTIILRQRIYIYIYTGVKPRFGEKVMKLGEIW